MLSEKRAIGEAMRDNRLHERFALNLPMRIRLGQNGAPPIETFTSDISTTGISFTLAEPLDRGCPVECEVTLSFTSHPPSEVRLRCRGWVVRVGRAGSGSVRIVVETQGYSLCT